MDAILTVDVPISPDSLIRGLCSMAYDDIVKFVVEMDSMVADVGFSELLVSALVKSLKSDSMEVNLPFIDWDKVVA